MKSCSINSKIILKVFISVTRRANSPRNKRSPFKPRWYIRWFPSSWEDNRNAFRRSYTNRSFKSSRLRLSILEKNFCFIIVHHGSKSRCARKNFQFTLHGAEFKKEGSPVPARDVFPALYRARTLRQQFSVFRFPLYSKLTIRSTHWADETSLDS